MDAWNVALYERLTQSRDGQLAAIAAKAIKEARYHLRFSRGWLVRLGDGTETSAQKMQQAIDNLWRFTAELFDADALELELAEQGIAVDPRELQAPWQAQVEETLRQATLALPAEVAYRHRGQARPAHRTSGPDAGGNAVSPARVSRSAVVKENAMQRLVDIAPARNPADLVAAKPDPRSGSAGVNHHRFRHGARREAREGEGWLVTFTPTYSGCPATEHLLGAIREQRLTAAGFTPVQVDIRLSPAWTTDWMTPDARERLRPYGISPPPQGHTCDRPHAHGPVACPRCASTHTSLISEFGSTACKALYRCNSTAVSPSTISNVFEAAMTTFHSLTVAKVEPETRDAVTITFAVPQALQETYRFRPGQHLTLKTTLGQWRRAAPLLLHLPEFAAGRPAARSAWRSKPSTAGASPAMPGMRSKRAWRWR